MDRLQQRSIIRELMKQYMEIAMSEKNRKMWQRFRDTNDLKLVRPPLIMEEIPWHEMNIDHQLDCVCEDPQLRSIEWTLRTQLFRHRYFSCDNYIEPVWKIRKAYANSGDGFDIKASRRSVDDQNNIHSHQYDDILEEESALDQYRVPVITAFPEEDKKNLEFMQDLVGDIIPIKLIGGMTCYSPWDRLAMLRGVEPILMDMYDRPEYLHKTMERITQGMRSEIQQMKQLGLYGPENGEIHCTPADITYHDDDNTIHCWFRTMAQMFSTVSPAMHYEFDMAYSIPLAQEFAFTYYGCCEPLDDRIEQLKKYPNLRKVGCSPWANVERTAEQLGKDFVLSRKPNPASVAQPLNEEAIRAEITDTVKVCLKYGCPCDFTLKDISTVGYRPDRLIEWAKIASGVLDEFYG